jgi:4-hydroxybenzoate polyprenyltransferase
MLNLNFNPRAILLIIMDNHISFKKIILFYRAPEVSHVLGIVILGFIYQNQNINPINSLLPLTAAFLYLAHGYSINDIFDNHAKINRKKSFTLSVSALILSLILASMISFKALLMAAGGHLAGMLYSVKPFRFKNKRFLDLIFNALCFTPLFFIGNLAHQDQFNTGSILLGGMFFLYFMPVQIIHQISDYQQDKNESQNNTVQLLGLKKSFYLLSASITAYGIFNYWLMQGQIIPKAAAASGIGFSLILLIYLYYKKVIFIFSDESLLNNVKIETRYLSIIYGLLLLFNLR